MEVVSSLSQGRTAAAHCGLFTHKSVPVIFEPPCISKFLAYFYDVVINISVKYEAWLISSRLDFKTFCSKFCI